MNLIIISLLEVILVVLFMFISVYVLFEIILVVEGTIERVVISAITLTVFAFCVISLREYFNHQLPANKLPHCKVIEETSSGDIMWCAK